MKEYFPAGKLVELFGLDIQILYYYDSAGIFPPGECNEKSRREKYEFDQIYELVTVSYMRRLGYSLEEIKRPRAGLSSSKAVDIIKQRSQKLRRQWQRLLNIDEVIQKKIRLMKQEMDGIRLDETAIKHFEDRRFISTGDEKLLYRENSFYFYSIIVLYEGDREYFGAYLYPDHEETPKAMSQSRIQIIRRGDLLYGHHLSEYEGAPDTTRHLREARPDLELGIQAINFNAPDQFVESDNGNLITTMQIRVLQIHTTGNVVPNEEV